MAETKTFSQLITAEQISSSDILALSVPFAESETGHVSRKASLAQVMTEANSSFSYPTELGTNDKTIFGAINELLGFNTRKTSDLFTGLIEGATVNSFSANIGPRTITLATRLQGMTFNSATKLFNLNNGKWPIDFIHCPVSIPGATAGENKIQISPFDGSVYYYGVSTNAINICITYPYGIRENYPTE